MGVLWRWCPRKAGLESSSRAFLEVGVEMEGPPPPEQSTIIQTVREEGK